MSSLGDELRSEVTAIFKDAWSTRDGKTVPEAEDLKLGNDAVKLDATVLYADLAGSTKLVDGYKAHFAAEIYKAYLWSAAKIIRAFSGSITSFDGDRIMAVFVGDSKNSNSVRAALRINYVVKKIITALALEAYLNHPGQHLFRSWSALKRLSPFGKLEIIAERLDIATDYGKRPSQTVSTLGRLFLSFCNREVEKRQEILFIGNTARGKIERLSQFNELYEDSNRLWTPPKTRGGPRLCRGLEPLDVRPISLLR